LPYFVAPPKSQDDGDDDDTDEKTAEVRQHIFYINLKDMNFSKR